MALVQCGECKAEMSERAKQCPACGWRKPKRIWLWALLAVFGFFVFMGWAAGEAAKERQAEIKLMRENLHKCWDNVGTHMKNDNHEQARLQGFLCQAIQLELDTLRGR